jgi:25S rRNA (uracil2843-N3)-methyltransferase
MASRYERQEKSLKKHPIISSSIPKNGTTPSSTITRRPEWKGPSFTPSKSKSKNAKSSAKPGGPSIKAKAVKEPEVNVQDPFLPLELQQLLLNIFKENFPLSCDLDSLRPVLQDVKRRLLERDFEGAFEGRERLEAYAAKWSPGRAICYAAVLAEVWELVGWSAGDGHATSGDSRERQTRKVISLGGGVAEVIAFGGLIRCLYPNLAGKSASGPANDGTLSIAALSIGTSETLPELDLHLIDSVDWSEITKNLTQSIYNPPVLSKYASASAKAANHALLTSVPQGDAKQGSLLTSFEKRDILSMNARSIGRVLDKTQKIGNQSPVLITLLFKLNELFSKFLSKTTTLLLEMTEAVPKGSILLVIDSPGIYSEGVVGKGYGTTLGEEQDDEDDHYQEPKRVSIQTDGSKRKYPMVWLLELILGGGGPGTEGKDRKTEDDNSEDDQVDIKALKWEKVMGDESRLFSLDEKLKYPLRLEDVPFQMHVFRRL